MTEYQRKSSKKWLADNVVGIIMVALLGIIGYLLDKGLEDFTQRIIRIEQEQDTINTWALRFISPQGALIQELNETSELSKKNECDIKDHNDRIIVLETKEGIRNEQSKFLPHGNKN